VPLSWVAKVKALPIPALQHSWHGWLRSDKAGIFSARMCVYKLPSPVALLHLTTRHCL